MALDTGQLWVKTGQIFTIIEQTYSSWKRLLFTKNMYTLLYTQQHSWMDILF